MDAVLQGKPPPSPAADLASYWRQQLVSNDQVPYGICNVAICNVAVNMPDASQGVLEDVCTATAAAGLPVTELRQLVRQCQVRLHCICDTAIPVFRS